MRLSSRALVPLYMEQGEAIGLRASTGSLFPSIRLNTWDRYMLPLPFGRGAVVWDIDRYPEGETPEAVAALWQEKLTAVEARADALCGAQRL